MTIKSPAIGLSFSTTASNAQSSYQIVNDATTPALSAGTATGNINLSFTATFSASTTPAYFDLSPFTAFDGTSASFTNVVGMKLTNTSGTGGTAITFGGGTNPAIAAVPWTVGPGGFIGFYDNAGITITNGSTDRIYYQTSTGTATGSITVFGR